MIDMAFGQNMDGPFVQGILGWARNFSDDQAFLDAVVRRLETAEGRMQGLGILSNESRRHVQQHGYGVVAGYMQNGGSLVVQSTDGRTRLRAGRYEIADDLRTSEPIQGSTQLLPEGEPRYLLRIDNMPASRRRSLGRQYGEDSRLVIGDREYLVFGDEPDVSANLRNQLLIVDREDDELRVNNRRTFNDAIPANREVYVIPLSQIPTQNRRSALRNGRRLEVGISGEHDAIVFDNLTNIPESIRGHARAVTRYGDMLHIETGGSDVLGVDAGIGGAIPSFQALMMMYRDQGNMNYLLNAIRAEMLSNAGPRPQTPAQPAAARPSGNAQVNQEPLAAPAPESVRGQPRNEAGVRVEEGGTVSEEAGTPQQPRPAQETQQPQVDARGVRNQENAGASRPPGHETQDSEVQGPVATELADATSLLRFARDMHSANDQRREMAEQRFLQLSIDEQEIVAELIDSLTENSAWRGSRGLDIAEQHATRMRALQGEEQAIPQAEEQAPTPQPREEVVPEQPRAEIPARIREQIELNGEDESRYDATGVLRRAAELYDLSARVRDREIGINEVPAGLRDDVNLIIERTVGHRGIALEGAETNIVIHAAESGLYRDAVAALEQSPEF